MAKKRITIAIPDAGPLISLAMGNALELLLAIRPGVQLVVTDIVHFETTALADRFADGAQIAEFLEVNKSRIHITETSIGNLALPVMRKQIEMGERVQWAPDYGEMSIMSFVRLAKTFNPGEPTMVLIEDDWFEENAFALPGNVHLVSTSSFLTGLERRGVINSAQAIKDLIKTKRPGFRVDHLIDREAEKIPQGTSWEESFVPPRPS